MRTGHGWPAWLPALLAGLSGATAAEPLGRLFFTPEQRAVLERQRRDGEPSPATAGAATRLDGMVVRSGGGQTVWIDGRPRWQADSRTASAKAVNAGNIAADAIRIARPR